MTLHLTFPENEDAPAVNYWVPPSGCAPNPEPIAAPAPPSDLRRMLRASTLIQYLLDAELHYALSSNTILLTFKSEAAAEWCVGVLTAGDLLS